ncbi:hypothetical protein M422DRAFT_187036, partial [Sphaerobolus stellatus SS14]
RFVPPSTSPFLPSDNYVGKSNTTLPHTNLVKGKAFDRFIQIWFENTNFETANSTAIFRTLAQQGVLLTHYYAATHPSQPNYVAAAGGDFFGLADDDFHAIPSNVSTIVDLLEERKISWASYQESLPTDGFTGYNYASKDYITPGSNDTYTYYWRKHSPTIIYDSVATVERRRMLHRNLNDFVADLAANSLPQWMMITPNIVNDGHDTDVDFAGEWLKYWLVPMLKDARFNNPRTLVVLTFDENSTFSVNNRVFTLLLGGAVPSKLRGTVDSMYYTHYSTLSTVQSNWELGCLGRQDTNRTVSNVFSFVASQTGYENEVVREIPLTNLTGVTPGPLNPDLPTTWPAPNLKAKCAGGGKVFVS